MTTQAAPSTADVMIRFAANDSVVLTVVVAAVESDVVGVVDVDPESRRKNRMTSAAASLATHATFLSTSSIAGVDFANGTSSTSIIALNFKEKSIIKYCAIESYLPSLEAFH